MTSHLSGDFYHESLPVGRTWSLKHQDNIFKRQRQLQEDAERRRQEEAEKKAERKSLRAEAKISKNSEPARKIKRDQKKMRDELELFWEFCKHAEITKAV
tara:strand:+ start:3994 stop:4293 length:300 start_codon:yes stop_codon:yes gene_type:complete